MKEKDIIKELKVKGTWLQRDDNVIYLMCDIGFIDVDQELIADILMKYEFSKIETYKEIVIDSVVVQRYLVKEKWILK